MNDEDERFLEQRLQTALQGSPIADFDAWQDRNREAIAYLNPVVTAAYRRKRKIAIRIAKLSIAAMVLATIGVCFRALESRGFAQVIESIEKAESISFSIQWFDRFHSVDGKRTWLVERPSWERDYLAPGRYRDTRYDKEGQIASVDIEDVASGESLHLDMKKREATRRNEPSGQFGPGDPFVRIVKVLERDPIEFVGKELIDGKMRNVFRSVRAFANGKQETTEIWLDAQSKQLVGFITTPGDAAFRPTSAADRDHPAESKFSQGEMAGVLTTNIVFNAQLDPELFSLTPPDGFTIIESETRPRITEEMMIQWLGVTAKANGDTMPDSVRGLPLEKQKAIIEKPESQRTTSEQAYLQLSQKHQIEGNPEPLEDFIGDSAEPDSFRYLGKGVRFGDGERIVLYYKAKATGRYRAVYGDLSIKDIQPDDLPLPVQ